MSKHCLRCYTWKSQRIKVVKALKENGFTAIQAENLHDKCVCHLMSKHSHMDTSTMHKIKPIIIR